jgi:hypothetical protein
MSNTIMTDEAPKTLKQQSSESEAAIKKLFIVSVM